MSAVCYNVGTEPSLQPVTWEPFEYSTANREDCERMVPTLTLWLKVSREEIDSVHIFDVRIFHTNPAIEAPR